MSEKIKTIMIFLGLALTNTYSIFVTYTFFLAYFNGYQVKVMINNFGEAHIEFVLLLITVPLSMWAIYQSCKNLFTKNIKKDYIKNNKVGRGII